MIDLKSLKKAIVLTQHGKTEEAENIYKDLLKANPDDSSLLSVFGLFYVNIGDFERAAELLQKSYDIKKTLGTVSALGFAEYERGDYVKAANYLEEALEYGENADIYNKLIISLFEIHRYEQAIKYSEKMYELYPKDVRAITNRVKSLTQSGKMMEAQEFCIESLKENPESAALWFHLGYLKELIFCDDVQARECYKAAAELGNKEADYNIAVSCFKLGEYKDAEFYYKRMLSNFPNDIETMTSLGMCYLAQKKFKEGYELFYKRELPSFMKKYEKVWKPGDSLENKIAVICEQGLGDHIQFVRYLPFLGDRKVQVAAPAPLKTLFKNNYPEVEFVDFKDVNPKAQVLRITDLAYILDMDFYHIPYSEGYLKSETAEIVCPKLKVGLCWEAGCAGIRTMINRTINIKCFEPLLNLENIQVYSFQVDDTLHGNEKYTQMINLAKDFKDFSDTARSLMAMDVVVTVDTSVAHLAGALGVKTYLLLPYAADWRWFSDTETTPWYKSIEIFKQTDHISWEEPINNIIEKLK